MQTALRKTGFIKENMQVIRAERHMTRHRCRWKEQFNFWT